jgi:hypothetical protein
VTRFVVDCETLLRITAGEIEVAPEHQLVAPTLVRSQALSALYQAARKGEISAAEGLERVTRINSLNVRFLGDKVLAHRVESRGSARVGNDVRGRVRGADTARGGRVRHLRQRAGPRPPASSRRRRPTSYARLISRRVARTPADAREPARRRVGGQRRPSTTRRSTRRRPGSIERGAPRRSRRTR